MNYIILLSQMQATISDQEIVELDGHSLTLTTLDRIIKNKLKIGLSHQTWQAVIKSRNAISKMMQDPLKVVYGITTGFGSFANVCISPDQRYELQLNLIRSHAVCVGIPTPLDIVKRMEILRINTLAKGRSGICPQNLQKFIEAYNCNYLPLIPQQGTVGASGDLAPLAHLALGMLGEGSAWDYQTSSYQPAQTIMQKLGLRVLQLKQKEGLALINGTQFMTAFLSDSVEQTCKLFESSLVLYALSVQIFGVDRSLFSKQSQQLYQPFNSQLAEVISKIRQLLGQNQSALHKRRQIDQQVSSLLDSPQAFAAILKTIRFCRKLIEEQMNSATDNPLVYYKEDGFPEDQLVSAGNFHGEYVAKVSDFLGIALFQLGKFSQARISKYINGKISRLPPFLIQNGGINSGFMIAQYTTAALLSESKVLVKPASVDSIITSAGQQDHVSMGGFAARKSKLILENMANIHAVQLLIVNTAIEELVQLPTSPLLEAIIYKVRKDIKPLLKDRYYGPDIKQAAKMGMVQIPFLRTIGFWGTFWVAYNYTQRDELSNQHINHSYVIFRNKVIKGIWNEGFNDKINDSFRQFRKELWKEVKNKIL